MAVPQLSAPPVRCGRRLARLKFCFSVGFAPAGSHFFFVEVCPARQRQNAAAVGYMRFQLLRLSPSCTVMPPRMGVIRHLSVFPSLPRMAVVRPFSFWAFGCVTRRNLNARQLDRPKTSPFFEKTERHPTAHPHSPHLHAHTPTPPTSIEASTTPTHGTLLRHRRAPVMSTTKRRCCCRSSLSLGRRGGRTARCVVDESILEGVEDKVSRSLCGLRSAEPLKVSHRPWHLTQGLGLTAEGTRSIVVFRSPYRLGSVFFCFCFLTNRWVPSLARISPLRSNRPPVCFCAKTL